MCSRYWLFLFPALWNDKLKRILRDRDDSTKTTLYIPFLRSYPSVVTIASLFTSYTFSRLLYTSTSNNMKMVAINDFLCTAWLGMIPLHSYNLEATSGKELCMISYFLLKYVDMPHLLNDSLCQLISRVTWVFKRRGFHTTFPHFWLAA